MRIRLYAPLRGINTNWSTTTQPQFTSPSMLNVRPRSVFNNRAVIGQRPSIKKAYQQCIGGGNNYPVVAITQITTVKL